jgi:hypothetical protein
LHRHEVTEVDRSIGYENWAREMCVLHVNVAGCECSNGEVEVVPETDVDIADLLFGDSPLAPVCQRFQQLSYRNEQSGPCH